MTEDAPWLEAGDFSTPDQAARRLNISDDAVRAWARAGVIRSVIGGVPKRYLLCDDDIDELAELLRGVRKPTLALVRVVLAHRSKHE